MVGCAKIENWKLQEKKKTQVAIKFAEAGMFFRTPHTNTVQMEKASALGGKQFHSNQYSFLQSSFSRILQMNWTLTEIHKPEHIQAKTPSQSELVVQ